MNTYVTSLISLILYSTDSRHIFLVVPVPSVVVVVDIVVSSNLNEYLKFELVISK